MPFTTINKSKDHFNTKLYSGDGSTQSISSVGFAPDWIWLKSRSAGFNHRLFDVVRGAGKNVASNLSDVEQSVDEGVTAFNSDGFSVKQGGAIEANNSSHTYVSWNWKGGGTAAANTDGDINSSVSANTTAGFSIVKWTGNGSNSDQEVGTGLSDELKLVFLKPLTSGGTTTQWLVYVNGVTDAQDHCFLLNSNAAKTTGASGGTPNKGTTAGRLLLKAGSGSNANQNYNGTEYIAYCFAEKTGYSNFGTYVGGGSNFPFIYTGFRPSFIIIKNTEESDSWQMYDDKRLGYNVDNNTLHPDLTNAESTSDDLDILSNGFKIRRDIGVINNSGRTYIYLAFGQSIVGSNDVPATAR